MNQSDPEDSRPVRPNRVFPALAWAGIVILVGIIITLNTLAPTILDEDTAEDSLGLLMMRLQARYIVGTSLWTPDSENIYDASAVLNIGTIRHREAQLAAGATISTQEETVERGEGLFDLLGFDDDRPAQIGQVETPSPPLEQPPPRVHLEPPESPSDGGLVDAESSGRAPRAGGASRSEEDAQVVPVFHAAIMHHSAAYSLHISCADRTTL